MNVASPRFTGLKTTKTAPVIEKQVDQLVKNKELPANATVDPEALLQGLERRFPSRNFEVDMRENTYHFRGPSNSNSLKNIFNSLIDLLKR